MKTVFSTWGAKEAVQARAALKIPTLNWKEKHMSLKPEKAHSALDIFCLEQGISVFVPNHYRIFLEDEDYVFYIEKGNFDLYIQELSSTADEQTFSIIELFSKESKPFLQELIEGPVKFLKNFQEGDLLFSFSFNSNNLYHALLVANESCQVRKINTKTLQESIFHSVDLKEQVEQQFGSWLSHLSFLFTPYRVESTTLYFQPSETLTIKPNQTLSTQYLPTPRQRQETMWIQIKEGALSLFGLEDFTIEASMYAFYPCIRGMWFKSLSFTQIQVFEEKKDFNPFEDWQIINLIQKTFNASFCF